MKYNQAKYNDQRYNIDGTYHATSVSDSVTSTEFEIFSFLQAALLETITEMETFVVMVDLGLLDITLMDDFIQIQFTNKALNDTVKLSDWFSIRRTNTGEWFN